MRIAHVRKGTDMCGNVRSKITNLLSIYYVVKHQVCEVKLIQRLNDEVVQKCGPKFFGKIRIFARFCHAALPALMARMWPCKSQGRQGCVAKARENSNFAKILVHTFVQPHCFPFDVTLTLHIEKLI